MSFTRSYCYECYGSEGSATSCFLCSAGRPLGLPLNAGVRTEGSRAIKHLVNAFADILLSDERLRIAEASEVLVSRCLDSFATIRQAGPLCGVRMKWIQVNLAAAIHPWAA